MLRAAQNDSPGCCNVLQQPDGRLEKNLVENYPNQRGVFPTNSLGLKKDKNKYNYLKKA
jgi:hypothetical protein